MGNSSSDQDVFDVEKIRSLIELMNEHNLNEIDVRQGDTRIQLRRGGESAVGRVVGVPASASVAATQAAAQPAEAPVDEDYITSITSPMVGTFYSSPDPQAESYVSVGDSVGAETTVCIVEAMKVFNEIQAEVAGKIVAVLVENGEPVEFGQPMFKVDTRQ